MGKFEKYAAQKGHPMWDELIRRNGTLYERNNETRSPFERDYTRILHSNAYRRLKHKTQVFFNIDNDHICTRMEHVAHVGSVSGSIARQLGLNLELTNAIALGHDLGHAPFGHYGETVLDELSRKYLGTRFWHERNGLRFVDHIELLSDNRNVGRNLSLTYAVRDGIVSHCGELDQTALRPRTGFFDLEKEYVNKAQAEPVTWEGCAVKISDKIAYVGRDIEDALSLGFLTPAQEREITALVGGEEAVNTTVIIYTLISDICENSSPEEGICLSRKMGDRLKEIKAFNYAYIYSNPRFDSFQNYAKLVLNEFFRILYGSYDGENTLKRLSEAKPYYSALIGGFLEWLYKYCDESLDGVFGRERYDNDRIYVKLQTKELYVQAIIDFISGMTDRFAVSLFQEMLSFSAR